jgi:hypothetical protein
MRGIVGSSLAVLIVGFLALGSPAPARAASGSGRRLPAGKWDGRRARALVAAALEQDGSLQEGRRLGRVHALRKESGAVAYELVGRIDGGRPGRFVRTAVVLPATAQVISGVGSTVRAFERALSGYQALLDKGVRTPFRRVGLSRSGESEIIAGKGWRAELGISSGSVRLRRTK